MKGLFNYFENKRDENHLGAIEALHRCRIPLLDQHEDRLIQNPSVEMENFEKDTSSIFDSIYASSEIQQLNRPTPPKIRRSSNKGLSSTTTGTNQLEEDFQQDVLNWIYC
ncbi:unnamed protein product [Lepeophtheirus salmonis]|uniref:(salmon louse) hypothetical protein n=1 Tax=Lepeophtheirus salmonis TaxID=72036 RepID=A0A7R8CMX6_LEPSM|nr:unnamed protein product [Lepeophtheirus salmonis]CAF2869310.1 unnamed protein product [Lepeophtheirus salmonis]